LTCYHRSIYDASLIEADEDQSDSLDSYQLQPIRKISTLNGTITHTQIVASKNDNDEEDHAVEESRTSLKSTVSIKGNDGMLANMLSEEHIGKGKRALETLGQWVLENSYKLSLAGLYMASLATINVIRAGYCTSKIHLQCALIVIDSDYIHIICRLSTVC